MWCFSRSLAVRLLVWYAIAVFVWRGKGDRWTRSRGNKVRTAETGRKQTRAKTGVFVFVCYYLDTLPNNNDSPPHAKAGHIYVRGVSSGSCPIILSSHLGDGLLFSKYMAAVGSKLEALWSASSDVSVGALPCWFCLRTHIYIYGLRGEGRLAKLAIWWSETDGWFRCGWRLQRPSRCLD